MKARPVLFSAPMVRSLLDDSKTMTRRIVKPQPGEDVRLHSLHDAFATFARVVDGEPFVGRGLPCPYGKPGDRLWVRETWAVDYQHDAVKPSLLRPTVSTLYRASEDRPGVARDGRRGRWRQSIFMPRWASRITLEVTGVRVERLTKISEADAKAEGVEAVNGHPERGAFLGLGPCHREGFAQLWADINGEGSWAANPWVWVISFARVES